MGRVIFGSGDLRTRCPQHLNKRQMHKQSSLIICCSKTKGNSTYNLNLIDNFSNVIHIILVKITLPFKLIAFKGRFSIEKLLNCF